MSIATPDPLLAVQYQPGAFSDVSSGDIVGQVFALLCSPACTVGGGPGGLKRRSVWRVSWWYYRNRGVRSRFEDVKI